MFLLVLQLVLGTLQDDGTVAAKVLKSILHVQNLQHIWKPDSLQEVPIWAAVLYC